MKAPVLSLTVELGDRSYPIEIGSGWLDRWAERLKRIIQGRSVAVISDSNVAPLYAKRALDSLHQAGFDAALCVVSAGEHAKSQDVLSYVYDFLLERHLPRQGAVVALGGGVVGDLAGYAAATYLRGVDFIQVPTSLLAMVDSSVGGKTGINHSKGKNLIGAFWQPRLVFVDTEMLRTLPPCDLMSGLGEVIKHGIIRDAAYFDFVENRAEAILADDPDAMAHVVEGSCRIKSSVVAADERETTGVRALLNFGHTIGHAIETISGYGSLSHGEAVALGMRAAGRIALDRKMWSEADHNRMCALIRKCGFPTHLSGATDLDLLLATMKLDKKVKDGRIRFVLPTRIGEVRLVDDVTADEVRAACQELFA